MCVRVCVWGGGGGRLCVHRASTGAPPGHNLTHPPNPTPTNHPFSLSRTAPSTHTHTHTTHTSTHTHKEQTPTPTQTWLPCCQHALICGLGPLACHTRAPTSVPKATLIIIISSCGNVRLVCLWLRRAVSPWAGGGVCNDEGEGASAIIARVGGVGVSSFIPVFGQAVGEREKYRGEID